MGKIVAQLVRLALYKRGSLGCLLPVLLVGLIGGLSVSALGSQTNASYISFSYREASLEAILTDLEQRYDLSFSYQPSQALLAYRVSARSGLVALEVGLQRLLSGSPIEYRLIRGQIALRYNRRLAEELLSLQTRPSSAPIPSVPKPAEEIVEVLSPSPAPARKIPEPAAIIPTEIAEELPWVASPLRQERSARASKKPQKQRSLAQLSIFPGLSTHPGRETNYINTLGLNLPAGVSGGVAGAELGVVYNGIQGDLEGVQLSGLVNTVSGRMTGLQVAAAFNGAGIGSGVQIAGLGNYCHRTLNGHQLAPLFNMALNGVGRQFSLGLNISEGDVRSQIGLVNRGQVVKRYQIGLLNISDTIAGSPIGLLNLVRYGYNTLEVARTSTLPLSISLKLGAHRFYNIFEFGGGRRKLLLLDGSEERTKQIVWGLGYGFGWIHRAKGQPSSFWNTEIVGMHLNRSNRWQNKLNFVLSTRITYDWQAGRETHLFIGPALNLHWTQLSEGELDNFFVSSWRFFKTPYDRVLFRGVLGIRAGIRIGQH